MSYRYNSDILARKSKFYYWLKYVLEDKEFVARANDLKEKIKADFYGKPGTYDLKQLKVQGLNPECVALYESLKREFRVPSSFIEYYLYGHYDDKNSLEIGLGIAVHGHIEGEWIALKFSKGITHQQFRELWSAVEAIQRTDPNPTVERDIRADTDMKLVYCIQRALDKGYGFDEIARMYNRDNLPGYGKGAQVRTEKWLKSYYSKHSFLDK